MERCQTWKWLLGHRLPPRDRRSAPATETALTALGDARARQLVERAAARARALGLWIDHPERVLSTLLIGNTLVNVGAGALAAAIGGEPRRARRVERRHAASTAATAIATVVVLFFGEIIPKTLGEAAPGARSAGGRSRSCRRSRGLLWPLADGVDAGDEPALRGALRRRRRPPRPA